MEKWLREKKDCIWEKPLGLKRKAYRRFSFTWLPYQKKNFLLSIVGQVRWCVGLCSEKWESLKEHLFKKPLKSWSELVSACELLWSQIPSYFWGNYEFQHSAWGWYQGFMVLLLMRRQRQNKWGMKYLCLHISALTHTALSGKDVVLNLLLKGLWKQTWNPSLAVHGKQAMERPMLRWNNLY